MEQTNSSPAPAQHLACPSCNTLIQDTFYFCPHCGKKMKELPLSTSTGRQIFLYLAAVFLPPSGLFAGIKYLRQNGDKTRFVGWVLLALTVVSIGWNIYIGIMIYNRTMEALNNQLGGSFDQISGSSTSQSTPGYLKSLGY